ncbi:hypothetical protein JW906_08695 [bacterium]|nr:hypothetical protein [bacterium]
MKTNFSMQIEDSRRKRWGAATKPRANLLGGQFQGIATDQHIKPLQMNLKAGIFLNICRDNRANDVVSS